MEAFDEAIVELAAGQHWLFTRGQATAVGAPAATCNYRLKTGRWRRTSHVGVYVIPGHAVTWQQRLLAAVLAGPPGSAASHRSAAVLHGIREGTPIELTVRPEANHRNKAFVHRSVVARRDRAVIGGIPTTAIDRTLVDLAGVVDEKALEQALEAAFRAGLTTPARVAAKLEELAGPGRAGVKRLRRVLARRHDGRAAGSALEVRVIQLLRDAQLGEPVRQYEVRIGEARYFLDLAYPERRLAIELDGEDSHGGTQFQEDRTRQNALVLSGWTVLRFTWGDAMERADELITMVAAA